MIKLLQLENLGCGLPQCIIKLKIWQYGRSLVEHEKRTSTL